MSTQMSTIRELLKKYEEIHGNTHVVLYPDGSGFVVQGPYRGPPSNMFKSPTDLLNFLSPPQEIIL